MKKILLFLSLFSAEVLSTELEIISSTIVCTKNDAGSSKYSYHVGAILKNTGNNDLQVVTSFTTQHSSGISFSKHNDGTSEFRFGNGYAGFNGLPIIPSVSSLNIVILKPMEITQVSGVKSSSRLLDVDGAIVSYQPEDEFQERFGYWADLVQSSEPSHTYLEQCKS